MPPPIGDSFSLELKQKLAKENFKIKAVLRFYCNVAMKIKRFIFIGIKYYNSKIALLFINTDVNVNFAPTDELKAEHIFIESNGKDYLTNDSHIDCTQLIIKSYQEVFSLLENNPSIHLGVVSDEDHKIIRNKICNSKLITNSKKKEFGVFIPN